MSQPQRGLSGALGCLSGALSEFVFNPLCAPMPGHTVGIFFWIFFSSCHSHSGVCRFLTIYYFAILIFIFTCGGLLSLVAHVFKKMRGIVAHFEISTLELNKLHGHQASLGGSTSSPTADCETRVS